MVTGVPQEPRDHCCLPCVSALEPLMSAILAHAPQGEIPSPGQGQLGVVVSHVQLLLDGLELGLGKGREATPGLNVATEGVSLSPSGPLPFAF